MDSFKTPVRNKNSHDMVKIPASHLMKRIGFGTGIAVYEMQRSPVSHKIRSPWAVKKVMRETRDALAKCMDKRLRSEAEILRKLDHPNIVGFRAISRDEEGKSILAMEECTSSLGDMIENRLDNFGEVPYPPENILKVSKDISKALDYLHNKAFLLHGDMKSFNVLVNGDFSICKLCDFGVCIPLTKSGEIDKERCLGQLTYSGTDLWSAPEVMKYPQDITAKADIYAFGLIIWEMIALSPPVDVSVMVESDSHLEDASNGSTETERDRPPLPDIDLGSEYNFVLEVYFCCTSKNREERPGAADLLLLFEE